MKFSGLSIIALMALVAYSCATPKKVTYFEDAETIPPEILSRNAQSIDPVISPGDLLNIEVSGANVIAVAPFNRGRYVDADGKISTLNRISNNTTNTSNDNLTEYYLVNANGTIDFPIVGQIHVGGLTKNQVATEIQDAIFPKYLTEKPAVDVRLMNFRVTVTGAVKNPGVYQSKNERMTFLEAIAMAGDLDIRGDRENIILYRTNADGSREVHRLDLHDKNILLSPYFTLQQNDIIYVEPNKSLKQSSWQLNPGVSAAITVVGGISSVASLVIGIVNLTKN